MEQNSIKYKLILIILIITALNACTNNGTSNSDKIKENTGKLDKPKNLQASFENNKVRLTWEASANSENVASYTIERSVHYKDDYRFVINLLADQLEYIDPVYERKYGDSFVYRVSAINITSIGISDSSNVVTLGDRLNISHHATQVLTATNPIHREKFGSSVAFSQDGMTMAITTRDSLIGTTSTATVQIFGRIASNNWASKPVAVLKFKSNANFESFAFSPDGNNLAMSDTFDNIGFNNAAGSITIISKNNSDPWNSAKTSLIVSPLPGKLYEFGTAVTFSPDSKTIAIAEKQTGIVRLFNKTNTLKWETKEFKTFNSRPELITLNIALAFNPAGNILAIGDPSVTVNNIVAAGRVQLFTKNVDGTWNDTASSILRSKQIREAAFFGHSLAFSPDGLSIAIGEAKGMVSLDNSSTYTGGNVQLFSQLSNKVWNSQPDEIFVSSTSLVSDFGSAIAFNSAGSMLAIGELSSNVNYLLKSENAAGSVLVFFKNNAGIWNVMPSVVLASKNPLYLGEFGQSFTFSPIDNTFIVGERNGTLTPNISNFYDKGIVNIYDTNLFK